MTHRDELREKESAKCKAAGEAKTWQCQFDSLPVCQSLAIQRDIEPAV